MKLDEKRYNDLVITLGGEINAHIWSFLQSQHLVPHLLKGYFGLESEQQQPQPASCRAPYLDLLPADESIFKTDFADNMLEMVALLVKAVV